MIPARRHRPRRVRGVTHALVVLARGQVELAVWPLVGCPHADLAAIDDLAQWQLAARRAGCTVRLRQVTAELRELLDLAGLDGSLQVVGETERGEQLRVDEVVVPDDPAS